ncbi:MAG: cytochrome c oxidase assembly protein [Gammaproteobacteria bacterium]|nr:cytochrome c oxidase assembly protein [Gammaproteobacteria bacterium]
MNTQQPPVTTRNLALRLGGAAVLMFGFGFALVPLYDIFCEVTGIRFELRASDEARITEQPALSRAVTLELLASTGNGAPWEFRPVADSIEVQTGLMQETAYFAKNLSGRDIVGTATPDVAPREAGRYLKKVECFCFTEQPFAEGEARNMPVRFYIEPDLPAHIDTITLAYTFHEKPSAADNAQVAADDATHAAQL